VGKRTVWAKSWNHPTVCKAFSPTPKSGGVSNFQGRYPFALSEAVARGELRPLRNPDEHSEEEER